MTSSLRPVNAAGTGMTPFGRHLDRSFRSLAQEALRAAVDDAGITADEIQYVAFANGAEGLLGGQEMIRGQVALRGTGIAGVPIVNVENACAGGSTAVHLAWLAVASGHVDVAAAVGVEKLVDERKERSFDAIAAALDVTTEQPKSSGGGGSVMMAAYAAAAREYARRYGDITIALAEIAVKNRDFATDHPLAQFRTRTTVDEVLASRQVDDPLTLLLCSPLTDGAAAIVFRAAGETDNGHRPVVVTASAIASYEPGTSVVARAAASALNVTGNSASDYDVFALHDACAFAELVQYEEIGLVEPGGAPAAVRAGLIGRGGRYPTNTDGGLMSRGHPLGATGLAQVVEVVTQLRGEAGRRQVEGGRRGLAMNGGGWLGDDYATAVCTTLRAG